MRLRGIARASFDPSLKICMNQSLADRTNPMRQSAHLAGGNNPLLLRPPIPMAVFGGVAAKHAAEDAAEKGDLREAAREGDFED